MLQVKSQTEKIIKVRFTNWHKSTLKRSIFEIFKPKMDRELEKYCKEQNLHCQEGFVTQSGRATSDLPLQLGDPLLEPHDVPSVTVGAWCPLIPSLLKSGSSTSIHGIVHLKTTSNEPGLQNAHKNLGQKTCSLFCWGEKRTHSGQVSFASALKAMQKAMFLVMAVFIYWIMVE